MGVFDKESYLEILKERRLDVLINIKRTTERLHEHEAELRECDHTIAEIELELEGK